MEVEQTKNKTLDEKFDNFIKSIQPKEKSEIIRNNAWLGTCAATVAAGLYTALVDWNPVIRAGAHFTGALAIPAGGAFVSSLAMHGIEGAVNFGINKYNEKHPENQKEQFEINPKIKTSIKLLSSAIVGITYAYGTLGTEMDQFAKSGIMQYEQYAADIVGSLGGIAAFHKLDIKDTFGSFMGKAWKAGQVLGKPIDKVIDLFKGKSEPEKTSNLSDLSIEEINITEAPAKEEPQAWDLSLYQDSSVQTVASKTTTPEQSQIPKNTNSPTNDELSVDDEINI